MKKSKSFRLLAIDVSNSFTKIALFSGERIAKRITVATKSLGTPAFSRQIKSLQYDAAIVSSVVPKSRAALTKVLHTPLHWLTHRSSLGIGIDYPAPASIGADRLCNAVACVELYGAPAIAVDMGTAVTFDVISANRKYIGGVIAPGLEAMTEYLYQRTALLPRIQLREPRSTLGKTTVDAMLSGAIIGYRGLIREVILELSEENFRSKKPKLIATGGSAKLIAGKMKEFTAIDPDLTLRGLYFAGHRVFGG